MTNPVDAATNSISTQNTNGQKIRVLLTTASKIELGFSELYRSSSNKLNSTQNVGAVKLSFSINGNKIIANNIDTGLTELGFVTNSFSFSGDFYRGNAKIVIQNGKLWLINELNLEDYLKGVVPSEMPGLWHEEALKSQAIIARTYALSHLNAKQSYDLCATTACQVYKGIKGEFASASEAVEETHGLVVTWDNKPALTLFHSDSGGYLEANKNVFVQDLPYLTSQPDPASVSPHSEWKIDINVETVQNQVDHFAGKIGRYKNLRVISYSSSGRVTSLELQGDKGTTVLEGSSATNFLRSVGAKSTLVKVLLANPLVLKGKGYGHGVGLSQYGARGMAESGSTFAEILEFYYPGTEIKNYNQLSN